MSELRPESVVLAGADRGLAHTRATRLIGLASDDPERLRRIADNLDGCQQRTVAFPSP